MDNFNDFADLEAEIFDWQDDMIVLSEDENERFFQDYINSNYDY